MLITEEFIKRLISHLFDSYFNENDLEELIMGLDYNFKETHIGYISSKLIKKIDLNYLSNKLIEFKIKFNNIISNNNNFNSSISELITFIQEDTQTTKEHILLLNHINNGNDIYNLPNKLNQLKKLLNNCLAENNFNDNIAKLINFIDNNNQDIYILHIINHIYVLQNTDGNNLFHIALKQDNAKIILNKYLYKPGLPQSMYKSTIFLQKNIKNTTPIDLIKDVNILTKDVIEKRYCDTYYEEPFFHVLIKSGNLKLIEHFSKLVDINITDTAGLNPLHKATYITANIKDIIKIIKKNHVPYILCGNKTITSETTPIHIALQHKNLPVVKILFQYYKTLINFYSPTFLYNIIYNYQSDIAVDSNYIAIVLFLLQNQPIYTIKEYKDLRKQHLYILTELEKYIEKLPDSSQYMDNKIIAKLRNQFKSNEIAINIINHYLFVHNKLSLLELIKNYKESLTTVNIETHYSIYNNLGPILFAASQIYNPQIIKFLLSTDSKIKLISEESYYDKESKKIKKQTYIDFAIEKGIFKNDKIIQKLKNSQSFLQNYKKNSIIILLSINLLSFIILNYLYIQTISINLASFKDNLAMTLSSYSKNIMIPTTTLVLSLTLIALLINKHENKSLIKYCINNIEDNNRPNTYITEIDAINTIKQEKLNNYF